MKTNKLKSGRWIYIQTNETLLFKGELNYTYEVDLEKQTVEEWRYQLSQKNPKLINEKDLKHFDAIVLQIKDLNPTLPIFINKYPTWFAKMQESLKEKEVQ